MKTYEWAVIGSGITGITTAEILTRQGHSVILIEKNEALASETTREFHEWLHIGSLYTLVPDKLKTLRFILGAIDDLIEYYSSFERMNLLPTESGLKILKDSENWFNKNYIHFKYRIRGRKITFPWIIGVARSIQLIEKIHNHDWLRRRAGVLSHFFENRKKRILSLFKDLINSKDLFKIVRTPDFTINSRFLLKDLVATSIENGLQLSVGNTIEKIESKLNYKLLIGSVENIQAKNIALCNGTGIKRFSQVKTDESFAPIAVVSDVPKDSKSFVELDYFTKNCINLLTKEDDYGLAGGISLSKRSDCDKYLDYVIKEHQKFMPSIKEVSRYVGVKSEITFKNQPRGYLYHIVNTEEGIWALIPGKFTLSFSMAPEFYRRVYKKNPKKHFKTVKSKDKMKSIVSETVWKDILIEKRKG